MKLSRIFSEPQVLRSCLATMCGVMTIFAGTTSVRGQCDPQEQTKLFATDAAEEDEFGYAVSVSGDTAVVGAYWDDDACPLDPSCNSGSAYVFVRSGTVWTFQQKLTASDAAQGDGFGGSVGISGDTVVIGADTDDNVGGADAGAAYVFVRSGGMWTEQKKLIAADATANDKLGYSAAVSGDTAVVAAGRDDTAGGVDAGSAYVFVRSGTNWTEQKKLIASDGAKDDVFGYWVAVSGDTVVVGSPYHDDACPLDVDCDSGSAYVFVRSGADWTEQQKLFPSDGAKGDNFGTSVGVSGDTLVIGSPYDDNVGENYAGSVFLYVRTGTVWSLQQQLFASDAAVEDYFGQSVAVSGDTAVVGAFGDGNTGPGQSDRTGSAYPFDLGCDDDGDGVANSNDGCPADANKIAPGDCGCRVADEDVNGNGISDCLDEPTPNSGCCAPGAAPIVGVITPLVMMGWKIRRRRNQSA